MKHKDNSLNKQVNNLFEEKVIKDRVSSRIYIESQIEASSFIIVIPEYKQAGNTKVQ